MKRLLYTLWVLLIVAAAAQAEHYGKSITTDSAAVAAANEITGLGEYYAQRGAEAPITSVTPTIYRDSTTPFLHQSHDGRQSWRVVYSDMEEVLQDLRDSVQHVRHPTTLTLWLDSSNGTLLNCLVVEDGGAVSSQDFVAPSSVEEIKTMRHNIHSGIPASQPEISMLEALRIWNKFSVGARAIRVSYVEMTWQDDEAFPAWNLVFPGIYMKPSDYPDAVYAVDVWVDARSGRRSPLGQISGPAVGSPDAEK